VSIIGYRYVLESSAFEFFVQLPEEEAELLCAYFRWLSAHPESEGDGWHQDTTGRTNYASLCGPLLVVHWTDHAVREVRIVQLIRD
jgi:hypothetical protein